MSYDIDKDGDSELLAIYDSVFIPSQQIEVDDNSPGGTTVVNNHPQSYITAFDFDENTSPYEVSPGTIIFHSGYHSYFLKSGMLEEYKDSGGFWGSVQSALSTFFDVFEMGRE